MSTRKRGLCLFDCPPKTRNWPQYTAGSKVLIDDSEGGISSSAEELLSSSCFCDSFWYCEDRLSEISIWLDPSEYSSSSYVSFKTELESCTLITDLLVSVSAYSSTPNIGTIIYLNHIPHCSAGEPCLVYKLISSHLILSFSRLISKTSIISVFSHWPKMYTNLFENWQQDGKYLG